MQDKLREAPAWSGLQCNVGSGVDELLQRDSLDGWSVDSDDNLTLNGPACTRAVSRSLSVIILPPGCRS